MTVAAMEPEMTVDTKLERARDLIVQLRSLGKETEAMALEQMLTMTEQSRELKRDEEENPPEPQPESPSKAARRQQLQAAKEMAATLRANGEIEKAEQIEQLLAQAPSLDEPSETSQMIEQRKKASIQMQQDKVAHIESLLNKATSFTENPIALPMESGPVTLPDETEKEHDEIEDRREAARQLAVQLREAGQVDQAERIEQMLAEVDAQAQPRPEAPVLCQPSTEVSEDPDKSARMNQIESARQLAAQLRRNGQVERAEQIEALLAQAPDVEDSAAQPAQNVPLSKTEQTIQMKKERELELRRGLEMIVLLHSKGRTQEADELVRVVAGLAQGMTEMDDACALDGLDKLCGKIECQTDMIGSYITQVENSIPESTSDTEAWKELNEMCTFLDSFVLVLETQAGLAREWISMLGNAEAKECYSVKLESTNEVIKSAKCISMQLEMLYTTIRVKEESAKVQEDVA